MRVALIQPCSVPPFAPARTTRPLPPLALAELGAAFKAEGHDVRLLDADPRCDGLEGVLRALEELRPGLVGIPAPVAAWPEVAALAPRVAAPTFVWGPMPTMFPEFCLVEGVDAAIVGEPEDAAIELAAGGIAAIPGVALAGRPAAPRPPRGSLDDLPWPAWELLDLGRYALPPARGGAAALPIRLSRGCAHAECHTCASARALTRRYVRRDPELAAAGIASLCERLGVSELTFVDDEWIVGGDWVRAFCGALRAHHTTVRWSCEARPTQVDFSLLDTMRQVGCREVLLGLEVLDTPLLHRFEKQQSAAQCAEAVRHARHARVSPIAVLVAGLPGCDPERWRQTEAMARELDVDGLAVLPYRPVPGTPGWDGLRPSDLVEAMRSPGRALVVPEGYRDRAAVEADRRRALRSFYGSPQTWTRVARRDPRGLARLARWAASSGAPPIWSHSGAWI